MPYDISIRDLPERRLAAMAHRGAYAQLGRAFAALQGQFQKAGLLAHVRGVVGIGYDDPAAVPQADLRADACFIVTPDCPIEAPLHRVILPAGPVAVLMLPGSYDGLAAAYRHLLQVWLPASGRMRADHPPYEEYVKMGDDLAEADQLTAVCLPLRVL
ncbi:MAG: GyrI-like domain-containing protein [Rhodobacteraceae bacterium]|nr:GyrI-like domain-containing protein [Paracoccaceae bacterium]